MTSAGASGRIRTPLLLLALLGLVLFIAWLLLRSTVETPRDAALHGQEAERVEGAAPAVPQPADALPVAADARLDSAWRAATARDVAPLGSNGATRSIAGWVHCPQGGAIAGATVRALPAPPALDAVNVAQSAAFTGVLSGAGGRFVLADVPVACLVLECFFADDPDQRVTQEITIWPQDKGSCHFLLDPGITVFGIVAGLDGKPVAGATIGVDDAARGTTDAKGSYALHHVRSEKRERGETCYAEADGFVRETQPLQFPSECNGQVQINFRIGLGGSIVGTVTDTDALPVAGVDVRIEADLADLAGREPPKHLTTSTGDDGSYRLSGVPPGRYIVQFGMPRWAVRYRGMEFWEDDANQTLQIRTRPGPGTTLSATGEAWRGLAARSISDVNVPFTLEPVRLDVVLDAGATVEGRVLDEAGRPVADASIIVQRLWRRPGKPRSTGHASESEVQIFRTAADGATPGEVLRSTHLFAARSDASGRYRIEHLPAGEMLLLSSSESTRNPPQSRLVLIEGTAHLTGIDCLVGPGVTLRGRVLDTDGRPVTNARLNAWPMGSPYFLTGGSDAEGWFEIRGLTPSTVLVEVQAAGHAQTSVQLVPDDASHDIVLKPGR